MKKSKAKSQKPLAAFLSLSASILIGVGVLCGVFMGMGRDPLLNYAYTNDYVTKTKVGYNDEFLGEVPRHPQTETQDGGFEEGYPEYGKTLPLTEEQRGELIAENKLYCGVKTENTGGSFDKMDSQGCLYLNGERLTNKDGSFRKLFKHTASVNMYEGNVSPSEPAISKMITYMPRGYTGYGVTGMYAPAGELITVKISKEDMIATQGITIHIGQALYNGQANNIWTAREMNRMPVILNTMEVTTETAELGADGYYTAYVGSFFGGPIYVRNENVTFSVQLSGGVRYSHFILGYTTREEFELNKKSSAPYFDLEVWENGVLHSGPRKYADAFTYDDLYKIAVYWDKVALVSTKVGSYGVVFLYDPFVAAGAAVAFPGRNSVNCPASWMSASLNYESMVSVGAWGNMHEYNHNFQGGWGRGDGGEVTNNALNLVEYSLFTKISSARQINNYGASGLSDWNRYTSATWALNQAMRSNKENDLSQYAAILHNFGQDMFIKAIQKQKAGGYGQTVSGWARAITEVTHNDMTYFLGSLVPNYSIDEATKKIIADYGYPTFVPVASVYQTGKTYTFDGEKRDIITQRPYQIDRGQDFTVDLRPYQTINNSDIHEQGSIIVPSGFTYKIVNINTDNLNGSLAATDVDGVYNFTPGSEKFSGQIRVTLELSYSDPTKISNQYVDLLLEFEQVSTLNKDVVERDTYYYNEKTYTDAVEAYNAGYAGYYKVDKTDNINTTQNSNADLWYTEGEYTYETTNKVVEIRGKIYVAETAKYRLALRGRYNVALYYSLDNMDDFKLAATYTDNPNGDYVFPNKEGTFIDLELKAGQWLYFKEVMIVERRGKISFVGIGWGKFTPPVPIFDKNNETIIGEEPESVSVSYANTYRNSYEMELTSYDTPYFYTNEYKLEYNYNKHYNKQTLVETNYKPWTKDCDENKFKIDNLFDDDPNTNVHTLQDDYISETNPFHITIDLNEVAKVTHITFNGFSTGTLGNIGMPKDFVMYGSLDNETFFEIGRYTDLTCAGREMILAIEPTMMRYFRLYVTRTDNGRYFAMNSIDFQDVLKISDATHISPDNEMLSYTGGWRWQGSLSSFGHVLVGKKGYVLKFKFSGTRFGILSSNQFKNRFEVYVDGVKVESEEGLQTTRERATAFVSKLLKDRVHSVEIRCLDEASIDSIFYK